MLDLDKRCIKCLERPIVLTGRLPLCRGCQQDADADLLNKILKEKINAQQDCVFIINALTE